MDSRLTIGSPKGPCLYRASRVKRLAARSASRVSQASLYLARNCFASLARNDFCRVFRGSAFLREFFKVFILDDLLSAYGRVPFCLRAGVSETEDSADPLR